MGIYDDVLEVAVGNPRIRHGSRRQGGRRRRGLTAEAGRHRSLERTAQGVHRVPVLAGGAHAPYAEAVAWTRGRGVISHESAPDLLELSDMNPPLIHVTVPSTYTPRRQGGDLYRVWRRSLDPASVIAYDGLPVVRPLDSVRDCLAYGTDTSLLLQACETARREGYLTDDQRADLDARIESRRATPRRT
jgi:predicted transcriptional regulator of viral defense system